MYMSKTEDEPETVKFKTTLQRALAKMSCWMYLFSTNVTFDQQGHKITCAPTESPQQIISPLKTAPVIQKWLEILSIPPQNIHNHNKCSILFYCPFVLWQIWTCSSFFPWNLLGRSCITAKCFCCCCCFPTYRCQDEKQALSSKRPE